MVLGTKEFTLLYPSLTNEVGTLPARFFGHLHALRFSYLSLWSDANRMQRVYECNRQGGAKNVDLNFNTNDVELGI